MAYEQHTQSAESMVARCAILTFSDTRSESDDRSGAHIKDLLNQAGHEVVFHRVVREDPELMEPALLDLLARKDIHVVLCTGGTGISRRDHTLMVVERHLTDLLPGFGELFRMLSWSEIGSGAMLSRAIGGVAHGVLVFAMPGSTKAVDLAMTKLILPELRHMLVELRK